MRPIDADALIERTRAHGQRIAYVESFIQDIKEAPTVGGWISVKDRLSIRNVNVLWWCELRDRHMGHVRIGFFEGMTNHGIPEVSCCGPNCIPFYWMSMPTAPEPPEEVSNDDV